MSECLGNEQLRRVLTSALSHPFYAGRAPEHPLGLELGNWPITRRSHFQERVPAVYSADQAAFGCVRWCQAENDHLYAFPVDFKEMRQQYLSVVKSLGSEGPLARGTLAANVCWRGGRYTAVRQATEICETAELSVLPIAGVLGAESISSFFECFSIDVLVGEPQKLEELARHVSEEKMSVNVPYLLSVTEGAEACSLAVDEALGVECKSGWVQCAELGVWAARKGELGFNHCLPLCDVVHVEIAEPDAHGFGELLVTSLVRERFPVIRFAPGVHGRRHAASGTQVLELQLPEESRGPRDKGGEDDFAHG